MEKEETKVPVKEIPVPVVPQEVIEKNMPKMRQIIIETDGANINVVKSEAASIIEFVAIMEKVAAYVSKSGQ